MSAHANMLEELNGASGGGDVIELPYYEVIKRSVIKSLDYYCSASAADSGVSGDSGTPNAAISAVPVSSASSVYGDGSNRMEAISLLLVALCSPSTGNSGDINYSKHIEQGN